MLVGEPGHDGGGGAVVPDVQEPAGAPGAHPVVVPDVPVEDPVARVPVVPGEAAQLLDVVLPVGAAHQVGADRDERRDPDPRGQADDEVGHGRLAGHGPRVPA